MLFFNPGRKIPGIPFLGEKINIYDEPMSALYNFEVDMGQLHGRNCYVFRIAARPDLDETDRDRIVFNSIITWFDPADMKIVSRSYDLSYDAGVYDFDVQMEVEIDRIGELLVPSLIRYTGTWKLAFRKRETGIFTATIFDIRE